MPLNAKYEKQIGGPPVLTAVLPSRLFVLAAATEDIARPTLHLRWSILPVVAAATVRGIGHWDGHIIRRVVQLARLDANVAPCLKSIALDGVVGDVTGGGMARGVLTSHKS